MTTVRIPARALLGIFATLFLTLAASGVLADEANPQNVSMTYISSDANNNNVQLSFRNGGTAAVPAVYFNYCEAKDQLPPNWDTDDTLQSSDVCKSDPRYTDLGLVIMQNAASGAHTYNVADPLDPARYIVLVSFWNGSAVGLHHDDGYHDAPRLITLEK